MPVNTYRAPLKLRGGTVGALGRTPGLRPTAGRITSSWFLLSVSVLASTALAPSIAGATPIQQGESTAAMEPPGTWATMAYGSLPLCFEANHGQTVPHVKFLARGDGYRLGLTDTEAILTLTRPAPGAGHAPAPSGSFRGNRTRPRQAVLRIKLDRANPAPRIEGLDPLPGKSHYLLGDDPKQWRTHIPHYARVKYHAVYPGIDLVYYGNQHRLEYDFIVAPGASPDQIRLSFEGARKLRIDERGDLVLETACGELREHKPVIYQEVDGEKRSVAGRYVLKGAKQVGFEIDPYDTGRPLVIDPVLSYATYLGGSGVDRGYGIAVDPAGNTYIAGETDSADFPIDGGFQSHLLGSRDAFVVKLNAAGTSILYATYLGGSGSEGATGIAVDTLGNAYVTGQTTSPNFPTANAFQTSLRGMGDAFVAKLDPSGAALLYATYLGGSSSQEFGFGIAVDGNGHAYVTGETASTNFPIVGALQTSLRGTRDAFVTRLDTTAAGPASLVYSTYLGGTGAESGRGIAADAAGHAYVTGWTDSLNFPTASAFQAASAGSLDAFATKLDTNAPGAASLLYSTYLGGSGSDQGFSIGADVAGNAYLTGSTTSLNFPTLNGYQTLSGGSSDAFVAKLDTTLAGSASLLYATCLGGNGSDRGTGIAVDGTGRVWVVGETASTNFPTQDAPQVSLGGNRDAFVTRLNPAAAGAASLLFSTYLGGGGFDTGTGIALDAGGSASVTGFTASADFPVPGALQSGFGGGMHDAFIARFAAGADLAITQTASPDPALTGATITYRLTVTNHGPGGVAFVTVTDELPAGVTFLSAEAPGGVVDSLGNHLTITYASLPAGASATLYLKARVNDSVADGAVIQNTATVGAASADPNPDNDTATVTTTASNPPPTITPPANVGTATDPGRCTAVVHYPAPTVTDNCPGVTVICSPPPGTAFPVGTTTVTCKATDSGGATATATFTVTVEDREPPTLVVPPELTANTDPGQRYATLDPGAATATDNCSGVTVAGARDDGRALTDPYPIGVTTITWTATDAAGNQALGCQRVTVKDVEPPTIVGASVNPATLWPPNHRMVDVRISYEAKDNCASPHEISTRLSVTCNEPGAGPGGRGRAPDWEILDAHHVRLRATRAGTGNGRCYTITITCSDTKGNTSSKTVTVKVPKHQGTK